ncbi:hypothetical protein [Ferrimonas marina]|uniref:Extracellular endo-alpha-(1->5)-L-arabinanase C-terminal domain-containing protein n=1 Tax=Ferrimonas marina TaxID=299255 RepID=A0A1M5MKC9_9GAMM|nr:hypothetical protein [Ferrimonas marina]SHG77758.1 hypothetical protein SAMN02745129_0678 [Ferrimonas marina]
MRLSLQLSLLLFSLQLPLSALAAPELTAEYLEGRWCLESMDFGGAPEPENRNWQFEPDGHFFHQNSVMSSEMSHGGQWLIEEGRLQIKPVYLGGFQRVTVESESRFVFHWSADMNIKRGPCP